MTSPAALKIVEAAIRLFAERGFDGVSITEIEAEAEATRAAIYQQFGSKEKLVEEALKLAISRLLDPGEFVMVIFENRKRQPLPELLRSAMERWYEAMPVETARLLIFAAFSKNRKWRERALAPVERIMELLTTGMEREIKKKGNFRPVMAAKALVLALLQYKALFSGEKPAKEEAGEVRGIIEQWLEGLAALT